MPAPFTTPVAFSVPFESEPERNNGFMSKNVQEAIEEALAQAIANDRFIILAQYNGNAGNGRVLEFFIGIDSEDAPLVIGAQDVEVLAIACSTTANSSNADVSFYDLVADPGLTTPLYTLDMAGQKDKIDLGAPALFQIPGGGQLTVAVSAGNIQKPHLYIVLSSTL